MHARPHSQRCQASCLGLKLVAARVILIPCNCRYYVAHHWSGSFLYLVSSLTRHLCEEPGGSYAPQGPAAAGGPAGPAPSAANAVMQVRRAGWEEMHLGKVQCGVWVYPCTWRRDVPGGRASIGSTRVKSKHVFSFKFPGTCWMKQPVWCGGFHSRTLSASS
jgi:hypothetical protein